MADDIECELIDEPVFVDPVTKKVFYSGAIIKNTNIKVGDCVKIKLQDDDESNDDPTETNEVENFSIGQILAVYVDQEAGVMVEVRWFYESQEVLEKLSQSGMPYKRQRTNLDLEGQLVESDLLDDVCAGAIIELVHINYSENRSNPSNEMLVRQCRYFLSSESNSLQHVTGDNLFNRGMEYSEYKGFHNKYKTLIHVSCSMDESSKMLHDSIAKLHISFVPDTLPCRDQEKTAIQNLVRSYIRGDAASKPIYISGMPGTGKSVTVQSAVSSLKMECNDSLNCLPEFQYIEVNCLRLQTAADAYTVFWRCLTGQHLSSKAALNCLNNYFAPTSRNTSCSVVLLLDEIDFIITPDGNVMYQFFNWPLAPKAKLILIGISNVMDLQGILTGRLKSRIEGSLTRLSFKTYTHEQIREILLNRLNSLGMEVFESKALEFLTRKASAVAGDLRAALKICQRAIQIHVEQAISTLSSVSSSSSINQPKRNVVSHESVKLAVEEYTQDPIKLLIRNSCQLDKSIIVGACQHMKASGEMLLNFGILYQRLLDLLNSFKNNKLFQPDIEFNLMLPPYEVFEMAIERLIRRGIFKRNTSRLPFIPRLITITLQPDISVVNGALKESVFSSFL